MGEAAQKLPVFLRVGGKEFLFLGSFRVGSNFAAGPDDFGRLIGVPPVIPSG
jgi:hypothetical protein